MKNTMRTLMTALFLVMICHFLNAQKLTEATVVYELDMQIEGMDQQTKDMLKNSTTEIAFKGKYTRVTNNVMMSKTISTTNNETEETVMLVEAMGNVMAVKLDQDQLAKQNEKINDDDIKIEVTEETMKILDIVCTKVIVTTADDDGEIILYVAESVKPVGKSFKYSFSGINGLPLRIEASNEGADMIMNAISLEKTATGNFSTEIPPGAQVIDFDMYSNMQKFMNKK